MKSRKLFNEIFRDLGVTLEDALLAPSSFFMNLNLSAVFLIADLALEGPDDGTKDNFESNGYYDLILLAKKYREQALDNIEHFKETSIADSCKRYFAKNHIPMDTPEGANDLMILKDICTNKKSHYLRKEQPLKVFVHENLFATFFRDCLNEFREVQGEKLLLVAKRA